MKSLLKHHTIYSLALVAFLFHLVVPFYATYQPPAATADATAMSALYGEQVLICTGDGFKWVSWKDLQSGKEAPKSHTNIKCGLCYVAAHGLTHAMPFSVAAVVEPDYRVVGHLTISYGAQPLQRFTRAHASRAPPFFSIV